MISKLIINILMQKRLN